MVIARLTGHNAVNIRLVPAITAFNDFRMQVPQNLGYCRFVQFENQDFLNESSNSLAWRNAESPPPSMRASSGAGSSSF